MRKMKRILALSLALTAAVSLSAQSTYPKFEAVDTAFGDIGKPRSSGGTIWTDYDGDGHLDVLVFGGTWSTDEEVGALAKQPMPKLFKGNQTTQTYTDVTAAVFGEEFKHEFVRGAATWLDYNNDGIVDLLMMGDLEGNKKDGNGNGCYFYKGSKDGGNFKLTLDATISAQFPEKMQSGEWGTSAQFVQAADFNKDGNIDVIFTGMQAIDGQPKLFLLYKNKGDGTGFEKVEKPVNGTEQFLQVYMGAIAIGDYNKDGNLDILFSGSTSNDQSANYRAGYYEGKGDGTFKPAVLLPAGLRRGEVAWIDYDKDGDLDALLTGDGDAYTSAEATEKSFSWWHTLLFRNDGAEGFKQVFNHGLDGATCSSVAIGDLNKDGYDDIVIMGENAYRAYYNNHGKEGNLFVGRQNSFNLSQVKNGMVSILDLNKDGINDVVVVGEGGISKPTIFYNKYPEKEYIPPVAPERTPINFVKQGSVIDSLKSYFSMATAWGDYDNDGDLDLFVYGSEVKDGSGYAKMYRNDGGTFVDITDGFFNPALKLGKGSAAWFDYNNDGLLDLVVSGTTNGAIGGTFAKVYRNGDDYRGYKMYEDEQVTFALPVYGEKDGGVTRAIGVADYNNDGYPDLLMNGIANHGAFKDNKRRTMVLYKNVPHSDGKTRTFEMQDTTAGSGTDFMMVSGGRASWGDYDNDGNLDILFNGWRDNVPSGESNTLTGIFRNNGDGTFERVPKENTPFVGSEDGESAWLDYNKDGFPDVIVTGSGFAPDGSWQYWNAYLYKNNGDGTFTEVKNHNLQGGNSGSVSVADLNNDGYPEVAVSGEYTTLHYYAGEAVASESHPDSIVTFTYARDYQTFNYNNNNQAHNAGSSVSMVDVNGDGKLDIVLLGRSYVAQLMNQDGPVATKPAKPTNLAQSLENGRLTLSWDGVNDPTIKYNVVISKNGASYNNVGGFTSYYMAMTDTSGFIKVGLENNATLLGKKSVTLSGLGLAEGEFTWGVVAIGANRAVSELAKYGKGDGPNTGVAKAALGSFKVFKRGDALVAATDIEAENAELSVYNTMGAQLWTKKGCFLGETEINGLPQGICFVVIRVGNQIMVEKAVK